MIYQVKSIENSQTKEWLLHKHYAKRLCSVSFAFGLYDDLRLVGICTIGKPASNSLCIGVCGTKNSEYVYELNRLCVNDGLEKNSLSYFVSKCLKMLPPLIVVSYADTSQNHHGYIYQATNWIYTGLSAKRTERYDPQNPNKHSKTCTESMSLKDLKVRERPQKHRYIYFTGSKTQRKKWIKDLKYNKEVYPKGENKRYDSSHKVTVQQRLF